MTWEIIISLIVAVTGLIGAIWAIVKYYDGKKTAREDAEKAEAKKRREAQQKADEEKTQQLNKMFKLIESVEELNKTQQQELKDMRKDIIVIQEDINLVHHELNKQKHDIHDNEIHRLQTAIVDFADKLRCGHDISLMNFQYIFSEYEKYHAMGGNTFIDSEMRFIKAKKEEWDLINSRE